MNEKNGFESNGFLFRRNEEKNEFIFATLNVPRSLQY